MLVRASLIAMLACGCWTRDVSTPPPASPASPAPATPAPVAAPASPVDAPDSDDHTGFDLYTTPSGITSWQLDGEVRHDRLPARIRGISPGPHALVIDGPPGYANGIETVTVERGQAQKVMIELKLTAP